MIRKDMLLVDPPQSPVSSTFVLRTHQMQIAIKGKRDFCVGRNVIECKAIRHSVSMWWSSYCLLLVETWRLHVVVCWMKFEGNLVVDDGGG